MVERKTWYSDIILVAAMAAPVVCGGYLGYKFGGVPGAIGLGCVSVGGSGLVKILLNPILPKEPMPPERVFGRTPN